MGNIIAASQYTVIDFTDLNISISPSSIIVPVSAESKSFGYTGDIYLNISGDLPIGTKVYYFFNDEAYTASTSNVITVSQTTKFPIVIKQHTYTNGQTVTASSNNSVKVYIGNELVYVGFYNIGISKDGLGVTKDEIYYAFVTYTVGSSPSAPAKPTTSTPSSSVWSKEIPKKTVADNERAAIYNVHRLEYSNGTFKYTDPVMEKGITYIEELTEPAVGLSKHVIVKDENIYLFEYRMSNSLLMDAVFNDGTTTTAPTNNTYSMKLAPKGVYIKQRNAPIDLRYDNTTSYLLDKEAKIGGMHITYNPALDASTVNISSSTISSEAKDNLIIATFNGCNLNNNGAIMRDYAYNLHVAKVKIGETYTVRNGDTTMVHAFFFTAPYFGMPSYNNTLTTSSTWTFTAPITGYVVFRSPSVYYYPCIKKVG